ncbi:DUF3888 domain-containing protein [Bacillaceae bacterium Marseille-Q3522]|nr:DUF3888 domain-containing protein [Bacillaceae bacterium Marseille-Q3522]
MKRLSILFSLLALFSITMTSLVSANEKKSDNDVVKDSFLVSLFRDEIRKSVANYYKDEVATADPDSIQIMYHWWKKDYNVVEVLQTENGHVLENTYVIKFTIVPQKKDPLGIDTIIFGVEPDNGKGELEVNMLKYEHKETLTKRVFHKFTEHPFVVFYQSKPSAYTVGSYVYA